MLNKVAWIGKIALCTLCAGWGVVAAVLGGVSAIGFLNEGNASTDTKTDEQ